MDSSTKRDRDRLIELARKTLRLADHALQLANGEPPARKPPARAQIVVLKKAAGAE